MWVWVICWFLSEVSIDEALFVRHERHSKHLVVHDFSQVQCSQHELSVIQRCMEYARSASYQCDFKIVWVVSCLILWWYRLEVKEFLGW